MEDAGRGRIIGKTQARTHFTLVVVGRSRSDDLPFVRGGFFADVVGSAVTACGSLYYKIIYKIWHLEHVNQISHLDSWWHVYRYMQNKIE